MSNSKALEGKVAIVTGASRGIGLAIAQRLATMGAKLSICARDPNKLEAAANELRQAAHAVFAAPVDVTCADQIASYVAATASQLGAVEILVNNAGIGYFGPTHEASEHNWDSVLDTNLKSVFLMSKAVAPGMIERRGGHIINIASLAGRMPFAEAVFIARRNGDCWG